MSNQPTNPNTGLPLAPSSQYRDNFYQLAPPWLATGNAEKYLYDLQLCSDLLLERMNQAIKIRLPGQGDPTQIPYLANDRVLVQGPAETNAAFILRLQSAFSAWRRAGSSRSVLQQLQAYLSNLQEGVASVLPEMAIVGGYYPTSTKWDTIYQGTPAGALPTHQVVNPSNFNWDGKSKPWRAWLILYMSLVATGMTGTAAQTNTATAGSYKSPGMMGSGAYAGVWVPATSGTPVNYPWITITNLTDMSPSNVGMWVTFSGSTNPGNNGTFPIVSVSSSTTCVIANPNGVAMDSGPLTWSISYYPFIGPGPVYGAPGYVYGQGQLTTPPIDNGTTTGGVWQPSITGETYGTSISWGLSVSTLVIQSIRQILKAWKSAGTYYPNIIIAFDGGTGVAGSAYSPNSSPGSGNPDGTFGSVGKNVNGVWVPTRLITSSFDAYCQGTGTSQQCTVRNIT
jgi:hypothetical protein